jgi:hypothetical protein
MTIAAAMTPAAQPVAWCAVRDAMTLYEQNRERAIFAEVIASRQCRRAKIVGRIKSCARVDSKIQKTRARFA